MPCLDRVASAAGGHSDRVAPSASADARDASCERVLPLRLPLRPSGLRLGPHPSIGRNIDRVRASSASPSPSASSSGGPSEPKRESTLTGGEAKPTATCAGVVCARGTGPLAADAGAARAGRSEREVEAEEGKAADGGGLYEPSGGGSVLLDGRRLAPELNRSCPWTGRLRRVLARVTLLLVEPRLLTAEGAGRL